MREGEERKLKTLPKSESMSTPSNSKPSEILEKRFLSFLIWQSIQSFSIFILFSLLTFSLSTFFSLFSFLFSMLLFSLSLHFISSPQFRPPASPFQLALGFLRFVFSGSASLPKGFVSRARASFCVLLLVCVSALSGFLGVRGFRVRGFCAGLFYGFYCVYKRRWVFIFPIVQRPAFFSYKMGLLSAIQQALKLSITSFFISLLFVGILPSGNKSAVVGNDFSEHFIFYLANCAVFLSWELIHHLHKVLHTKRFVFAPSNGSAAVETNPSESLLNTLEDSYPRSLLQYLAFLDLCMVCGSNIEPWRRAAFFEETGDTYKRGVSACLTPLEQFSSKLAEGLTVSADNIKLSHQLSSPNEICWSSEILELFNDFQLYAWCAQAIASLEVHSHKEDRFGVAQLSGSHATVLSTLLSCLLAVEASMGKKTNLQSPNHILSPAGIEWATNSTARREIASVMNMKRGNPSNSKSYALADVLKISIYSIVSEFFEEMQASAKMGRLEKDWLNNSKPIYGSAELLIQKLHFFLNFQAS